MRPRVLLIAGLALALAAAGCGSSGSSSTSGSTHHAPPASGSTTTSSTASTIDPNFDMGQTVQITAKGLRPKWLVSLLGQPVTWQNLTGHELRVLFDHQPVASGLVPPGGSFRFTPTTPISMTYHVTTQPVLHGALQVTPGSSSP